MKTLNDRIFRLFLREEKRTDEQTDKNSSFFLKEKRERERERERERN